MRLGEADLADEIRAELAKADQALQDAAAAGNAAARALYLAGGFAESGRRKHYYHGPDGTHDDAIVMARRL